MGAVARREGVGERESPPVLPVRASHSGLRTKGNARILALLPESLLGLLPRVQRPLAAKLRFR
eukprot:15145011-Alexandrium_andersonii.AAC.1